MNKRIQHLLLFEKSEIQTRLTKKEIIRRAKNFADPKYTDYYGYVRENKFVIAEKAMKSVTIGITRNSLAPVASAKIIEKDGLRSVSIVFRMNIPTLICFLPLYLISLLTVILFPFMLLLLHFAFFKPAQRLKESLEDLLLET